MPIYRCPKCCRVVSLPEGTYYCRFCGPAFIMQPIQIKLAELKPQLYCSRREPPKPPSPQEIQPIRRWVINKPEGGLWTSTFLPSGDEVYGMCSDWLRWCKSDMPDWLPKSEDYCWVLYPSDDAEVVEVDDLEDYLQLLKYYSWLNPVTNKKEINFARLARDFDGFHLTENGVWKLRHLWEYPDIESFYGWDCESTVWFRWKFDVVRPLKAVPHSCKIR